MDPKQSELIGLVRALVDSLEATGLSYAVGGAIAAWSEPRATKYVDITPASKVEAERLAHASRSAERGAPGGTRTPTT